MAVKTCCQHAYLEPASCKRAAMEFLTSKHESASAWDLTPHAPCKQGSKVPQPRLILPRICSHGEEGQEARSR